MEAFFETLKAELVWQTKFETISITFTIVASAILH